MKIEIYKQGCWWFSKETHATMLCHSGMVRLWDVPPDVREMTINITHRKPEEDGSWYPVKLLTDGCVLVELDGVFRKRNICWNLGWRIAKMGYAKQKYAYLTYEEEV